MFLVAPATTLFKISKINMILTCPKWIRLEVLFCVFGNALTLLEAIGLTALPHIGGLIGAFAMKDQVKNWYEVKIEKPPWKPPSWVSHFNSFTAILTIFAYFSIYQIQ